MSGEELYWLYVQENGAQGVGVEAWADLSVDDWHIWNAMADKLQWRG